MMCAAILGHKEDPKVQKPKYENRGINKFSNVHAIVLLLAGVWDPLSHCERKALCDYKALTLTVGGQ